MPTTDHILNYLMRCRELTSYCTQNGWIDNESLEYEVRERSDDTVLLSVKFQEVVMKGAGCVGRRIPCFGQVRLRLAGDGSVRDGEAVGSMEEPGPADGSGGD